MNFFKYNSILRLNFASFGEISALNNFLSGYTDVHKRNNHRELFCGTIPNNDKIWIHTLEEVHCVFSNLQKKSDFLLNIMA